MKDRLYSFDGVAEWLGISISTVKRAVKRKELRTVRIGARQKIHADELRAYAGLA